MDTSQTDVPLASRQEADDAKRPPVRAASRAGGLFPLHLFITLLMIAAGVWIAYRVHDQYAIVLPFPELAKIFLVELAGFVAAVAFLYLATRTALQQHQRRFKQENRS